MSDKERNKVYLVTGMKVAVDGEDGILIVGMLSDNPFNQQENEQEVVSPINPIGNFAFTRQQATFLRARLNEFLQDAK